MTTTTGGAMTVADLVAHMALIKEAMAAVMVEGEDYGKIPGCGDKPSLLKPGAEKLCMLFRLSPEYDVSESDLGGGHLAVSIKCRLRSIHDGQIWGEGLGSASTMETKWRFRSGPKELTDSPVPKEFWNVRKTDPAEAQKILGGRGFSIAKTDAGMWVIAIAGERVEHDNPYDHHNTVRKIAAKRSQVAAALTATAASQIYTQDLEELVENGVVVGSSSENQERPKASPKGNKPAPIADGVQHVTGYVTETQTKEGKHEDGSAYLLTRAKVGDAWYYTYDTDLGDEVIRAKGGDSIVEVGYTSREVKSSTGKLLVRDIKTIKVVLSKQGE
jgi:hypothetical protein